MLKTTGLDLSIYNVEEGIEAIKRSRCRRQASPSILSPLLLIEHIFSLISRPKNKMKELFQTEYYFKHFKLARGSRRLTSRTEVEGVREGEV